MKNRGQTIQIFLPDANPRGVRIAEITNRTVMAILFPRSQFEYILEREEISNVGFYFLFGQSDSGRDKAYIGETENFADRLKQHYKEKDFWNYAVVIISKTHAFTKTHVKYLEHISIDYAKEANRFELENNVDPTMPYVTESMEADMLDCFDTAKILLSTLGFPIFDSISKQNLVKDTSDLFKLKGKDADAEGKLTDDGFVVFKGSKANRDTSQSCPRSFIDLRSTLLDKEIFLTQKDIYILSEDYIFSSPSTAASIMLGRSANGWTEWKNNKGETLDILRNKQ